MLTIGGMSFGIDETETSFYGWLDPDGGGGRKPGLTWDLYISGQSSEIDVRDLLLSSPILDGDTEATQNVIPTLDFSGIEIRVDNWKRIEGFSTEDCSSFSFYLINQFDHLSMDTCSLSFLKREGKTFIVEFSGEAGKKDCGTGFPFKGLVDVSFGGIGMYLPLSEKNPLDSGRRFVEQHLPKGIFTNYKLEVFPRGAPAEFACHRLVFLPD